MAYNLGPVTIGGRMNCGYQPTNWGEWPKWNGDSEFRTARFKFSCSTTDYSGKTNSDVVTLLKNRELLEIYRDLTIGGQMQLILELGFFQGGMPLFLADMIAPKNVLAIDGCQPSDRLKSLVEGSRLSSIIELVGGIDQADTRKIRSIVDDRFGAEPLDMIIDDCSHWYPQTKACFEALFGYLRPGGKYIIEDWGWTHWPSAPWQTTDSPFHGKESMTNLVFELIMALGSDHTKIARVDFRHWALVVVTRGEALPHKAPIDLREMTKIAPGQQISWLKRRRTWRSALGFRPT